jgi:DNA-binding transcriptional LysR family regulator
VEVEKIELSDLRRAIAVSQHRSLRQAAQTLNIRQSTLSRRLRDIEYCLGACLFERTNGGTRPTAIGLEFLEVARLILDQSDSAFRKLKSRSRGEHGRISIGVYASLATGNTPEIYVSLFRLTEQFCHSPIGKSLDKPIRGCPFHLII